MEDEFLCCCAPGRSNKSRTAASEKTTDAAFMVEQLERFSFSLSRLTVVVLDIARIHTGKKIAERIGVRRQRGLFVFCLPTYSPHLNISETLWRKLKYEWLSAADYESKEHLQYAVRQALSAFGKSLKIRFSGFKHSSV
ncbi:MAG: transposase [Acidobacteriota bacterium]|nr:transposase [Acidobacteriota bacterium]